MKQSLMQDIKKKWKMIILDIMKIYMKSRMREYCTYGSVRGTEASLSLRKKGRWSRDVPTRLLMKNNFIKYIIISCLLIILILTGFSIYSNNLNNKLNEQIKIMLSEIGNQNKLIVASEINKQQDLVKQLALTLSSKNLDEEIIPLLQNIYDTNDYKNVGIVARDKTIYITKDKVEIKNENYFVRKNQKRKRYRW